MSRYTATERIGLNAAEKAVIDNLKWIWREQPIADMGIDAHMELVEGGTPSGKLVGVQVKTGKGNFHETPEAYTYYIDATHYDYWSKHSLPVVLIAHLPETGETLWVAVHERSMEKTPKGWKINIPKKSQVDKSARHALEKVFEGSPSQQKLRELALHEPLMRHIQKGLKVSVELEEWGNKSLGRSNPSVFVYDEHGEESESMNWMIWYTGYSIEALVQKLFPWADAAIDADFYEENEETEVEESFAGNDHDVGEPIPIDYSMIRPYAENGETATYRFVLSLNELGKAYLKVADYLSED